MYQYQILNIKALDQPLDQLSVYITYFRIIQTRTHHLPINNSYSPIQMKLTMTQLCFLGINTDGCIEHRQIQGDVVFMRAHHTQQGELVHVQHNGVSRTKVLEVHLDQTENVASVHHAQAALCRKNGSSQINAVKS